jgi:hypothetical protein
MEQRLTGCLCKGGQGVRFLILFLTFFCFIAPPDVCADETAFNSFIASREIVATIYFQANSEDLGKKAHERVSTTVSRLRKLQTDGRLIRVEGFSSPEGDREANFRLSFYRARTVADIIKEQGLPAEVTLTAYGDLYSESNDPAKERRVEIASYAMPSSLNKVEFSEKKILAPSPCSDVRQAAITLNERHIDSRTVDRAIKQKIADKRKEFAARQRKPDPALSVDFSQMSLQEEPVIDALTIEQAIMDKIAAEPPPPSAAVTQLGTGY